MQIDPLVEWQRLTETYRTMFDGELLELAADAADLTEPARQALGDEMRKRGLDLRADARSDPPQSTRAARAMTDPMIERASVAFGAPSRVPEPVADLPERDEPIDGPHEYTWKTQLCMCESQQEALQLSEALRQAGIENWIERPGARHAVVLNEGMVGNLQILVPADRLEEARQIAERPIPAEIVEQSKIQAPEFELPVCPKCGAADPVLEGVDPANSWLCEACGNAWTELAGGEQASGEKE